MSKPLTKLATLFLMLFLAGCGGTSKVTLKNLSSERISNVKIYASENLIWQGDLGAGKSVSASFNVDKDGALRMTGNSDLKKFDTDYLGYTTPNGGTYHTIIYKGQGKISYDYSTKHIGSGSR